MKIVISLFLTFLCSSNVSAQNEAQFLSMIHRLEAANNESDYVVANDQLEQLAFAYPANWLTQYYAALGRAIMSTKGFDINETNINKAIQYLIRTKQCKINDEVLCLESFVYSVKMSKAPFARWLLYKNQIMHPLEMAQKINSNNPRIYILQASIHKNIPTWLGGGCDAASPYIKLAIKKWSTLHLSSIQPHWGEGTLDNLKKSCPID